MRLFFGVMAAMLLVAGVARAQEISPEARKEADQVFTTRCSTCHGTDGKGAGPAGAALTPKPRNFTDKAWQGTVTDAHIEKVIVEGGMAVGKSPLMIANPDLKAKPQVVQALREKVRSFAK